MRTAFTATELTILRCAIQSTRLYLAVHKPQTLFSARLSAEPSSFPAAALTFASGTPTSGTVPAGATVWIGSSAGAKDKGTLRVRSDLTKAASGTLNVAEFNDALIDFAANDYLTVVEDYRPAAKYPRYSGGTWYMDYDTAYGVGTTIENDDYGPLARLGPPACGFIVGGHCYLKYVGERSAAYSPSNAIDTWAWTFPDASTSSSQGTTASPITVDYTAAIPAGQAHSLTVTEDTTNKTHTGRRLTFVFERTGANAPYSAVVLGSIAGGPGQGGYSADLRVINTTADQSSFPDGAHVVLFAEDYYADESGPWYIAASVSGSLTATHTVTGGTSGATGAIVAAPTGYVHLSVTAGEFIPGETITTSGGATCRIEAPCIGGNYPYRSNIVMDGWIVAETVRKNPETGSIDFTVTTLDGVLRTLEGYPVALTNRSTTPTLSWEDAKRLTMNTATLHFARWRSTIADIADVEFQAYAAPNEAIIKYVTLDKSSLFDQLNGFWQRTLLGWAACDLQGALYCEMDAVIDETVRGNLPTLWTVTKDSDLRDELEMPRYTVQTNSQTVLYAVAYRKPIGSKSPGDPMAYQGLTREITEGVAGPLVGGDLNTPDQATLNVWAGNLRAKANSLYRGVMHRLAGNWRVDPVPQARFVESFSSGDTIRGITLTSQGFIPRDMRMTYNDRAWALLSDVGADAETVGLGGVAITFPAPEEPPYTPPVIPPDDPPITPVLSADAREVWLANSTQIFYSQDYFGGGQPTWNVAGIPAGATSIDNFHITVDGSMAYCRAAVGLLTKIYKCSNPRTASPTWVDITLGGWTYQSEMIWGNYYVVHLASGSSSTVHDYYEYNGNTGITITPVNPMYNNNEVSYRAYNCSGGTIGAPTFRLFRAGIDTQIGGDIAYTGSFIPWLNLNQSAYYVILQNGPGNWKIHNVNTSTMIYDTGSSGSPGGGMFAKPLRGAYSGSHLYVVDGASQLCASTDGASFSAIATWVPGVVEDAKRAGGGALVWMPRTVTANNVPTRLYDQSGAVIRDMTGNFWSVASGDQTFLNLALVF